MYNDIITGFVYLAVFLFAYLIGSFRTFKDKEDIDSILKKSDLAMKNNSLKILNDFAKKLEAVNYENAKLVNEQNAQTVIAINTQIDNLNKMSELLANINLTLKSQTELYERISMLQKIIVKKKNIGKSKSIDPDTIV